MNKKRSRFKVHGKLSQFLVSKKIEHPSRVATLFLETFIESKNLGIWQQIKKTGISGLEDRKILTKFERLEPWRSKMEKLGLLICKVSKKERCQDEKESNTEASYYKPGTNLVKYINEESLAHGQVALKTDVEELREEYSEFKKKILEILEPPVSDDDIQEARNLAKSRHLSIAKSENF